MKLRSCVSVWTLLLCALLADVQALCADNCPAETVPTTNTTSIAFQSLSNCSISTGSRNSTDGSISGLTPGVLHEVQLLCLNCCKPVTTNPGVVQDLRATSTTSSISVTWTKPEGDSAFYRIEWTDENESGAVNETGTSHVVSDLTAGTKYVITVTAVAGDQTEGEASSLDQYTIPEKPGNIQVTDRGTDFLTISWSFSGGKDYFLVNVQNADPPPNTNQTTTNITGLLPGRVYGGNVTAVAGNLQTASDQFSFATVPTAVTELTVVSANATSIQLRWLRQSDQPPSFTYLVKALRDGHEVDSDSTQTDTYTFHRLNPGTLYEFQVFAVLEGVQSQVTRIENSTKPGAASIVSVTGGTTELSVSWEPAPGQVFSYSVQLSRGDRLVDNRTDLTNETTEARFAGLHPGVEYCAVVSTSSGPDVTEGSAVCNATLPSPPGPITVQFANQTSINFTWTPPLDMEPHQYNFSVWTFRGWTLTVNSWYLLEQLQPGTPYEVSVLTVGVKQYESSEERARSYTRPYSVTNLKLAEITTDSVTLEWIQPEEKSDYSYLVQGSNESSSFLMTVNSTTAKIHALESGSSYSFTVTTLAADGTEAEPVAVSNFTYPHPANQLVATTFNSTAVGLRWTRPLQYKDYYLYWVEVTGCDYQLRNLTEETVEVSELNPGTNCTFCVSVQAGDVRGGGICTSQYTKPEAVQPTVSSQGSNQSVRVSWTKPEGNVEKYQVNLSIVSIDLTQPVSSVELDGDRTTHTFTNLSAGRRYGAVVVAHSGPFHATSLSKENATFPNPPGPIQVLSRTSTLIHFSWTEAPFMEAAEFFYQLTLIQFPEGKVTSNRTTATAGTFHSLPSGTAFTVAVSTVGLFGFESQRVYETVTTIPLSVKNLNATAEETGIHVSWEKPDEDRDSYRYSVAWKGPDGAAGESPPVHGNNYTIDDLSSGSRFNISVATETADGTQAEPRLISSCTRAKPVKSFRCEGPNEAEARIVLSWVKPDGGNSGFRVSVNDGKIEQSVTCCSHNVSRLLHHTEYKISVETLSCGRESSPEILHCRTGITNPPIPPDFQSKVKTDSKTHNRFSLIVNPGLFNLTNGPITHVGVLVSKSVSGVCSDCSKYLEKTYNDFKADSSPAYLAAVEELLSRSSQEVKIEVGNNDNWKNKYLNGALDANTKYYYAVVLFTSLALRQDLVDPSESLFSLTDFSFSADLPISPATVGIAVGVTLGIFCVLFCVLIGFVIFWRRMAKKKSPDIQIHSLRAKVVPVKVEDYEAYFRKQRADSNCGFAEEFEDLKPVGTTQARIQALSVENKPKNRYANVLPYDATRVKLSLIHGNPSDDYINANYMPGYTSKKEFIAAQGPLPATVNEFWRMIWEKNVQTLVMLTRCTEQGRVKCEQYWSPGAKHFGNITVTTTSDLPLEDWTIRDFSIKNVKTAETRSVRQFHFTAWPDHGVPETTELLIGFRHLVREHMNQYSRHSPTVVHCSAGVGRTGTFIAIDRLIFQIERENVVDVYGIVHELRMHRALMVQTEDQYVFLNRCAMDLIRSRTGTNVDLIYQNTAALCIYENLEPLRGPSKNQHA